MNRRLLAALAAIALLLSLVLPSTAAPAAAVGIQAVPFCDLATGEVRSLDINQGALEGYWWLIVEDPGYEFTELASAPPCPSTDSDGDNVPDSQDGCPSEAGPVSNGGCPVVDPDPDGDGVLNDGTDQCPEVAGNAADGCYYDPDSDNDGIPDSQDTCDSVRDVSTGCDSDSDGFNDADDVCPYESAPGSANGCPLIDPGPKPGPEYTAWSNETPSCSVPVVTQTRSAFTTDWVLNEDGSDWVANGTVVTTESREVSLTEAELAACPTGHDPGPHPGDMGEPDPKSIEKPAPSDSASVVNSGSGAGSDGGNAAPVSSLPTAGSGPAGDTVSLLVLASLLLGVVVLAALGRFVRKRDQLV